MHLVWWCANSLQSKRRCGCCTSAPERPSGEALHQWRQPLRARSLQELTATASDSHLRSLSAGHPVLNSLRPYEFGKYSAESSQLKKGFPRSSLLADMSTFYFIFAHEIQVLSGTLLPARH